MKLIKATRQEIDAIITEIMDKVKNQLINKDKEYADELDRFKTFNMAALWRNEYPEDSLLGFVTKHLVSVNCMVEDLYTDDFHSIELWNDKIIDIIVYYILLLAMETVRAE